MAAFYKKIFARVYDRFMYKTERGLYKKRKKLISSLSGNVLEVGSGTGVNYQFYSSEVKLIALDPNLAMLKMAEAKADPRLNIVYLNHGVDDRELDQHIDKNSLDVVVSTLVLCSIPEPEKAIEKFGDWLKPGGKLVILEHIHAENKFNKKIQNLINPVWRFFADGCNLNRNTDVLLEEGGFTPLEEEYFAQSLRWVMGVYTVG
jgi:ubiquinone/menaquinone biosynthesis C-methylase UbiE